MLTCMWLVACIEGWGELRKVWEAVSHKSVSVLMGEGEEEGDIGDMESEESGEPGAAEASEFFRLLAL
jgi:hypothetical protein